MNPRLFNALALAGEVLGMVTVLVILPAVLVLGAVAFGVG